MPPPPPSAAALRPRLWALRLSRTRRQYCAAGGNVTTAPSPHNDAVATPRRVVATSVACPSARPTANSKHGRPQEAQRHAQWALAAQLAKESLADRSGTAVALASPTPPQPK